MALIAVSVTSCKTAAEHAAYTQAAVHGEELTVGTVQREIRVGMSGAEVATVLGSPNVVTTDELRREVWIYDKVSTTRAYSSSSGGVSALILGGGIIGAALVGGGGGGRLSSSAGAQTTSQKTLTIIIKFDEEGLVRDFAYHSSKFRRNTSVCCLTKGGEQFDDFEASKLRSGRFFCGRDQWLRAQNSARGSADVANDVGGSPAPDATV